LIVRKATPLSASASGKPDLKEPEKTVEIKFRPNGVTKVLVALVACLILTSVCAHLLLDYFGPYKFLQVVDRLFNVGREGNIPTFLSSLMLFFSALLLALIAIAKRADRWFKHWAALAAIFLFLSLDEAAQMHEPVTTLLRSLLGTSGIFHYAWVIPYGVLTVIAFVVYIAFLRQLPPRIRWLIATAGAIYVCGALGIELIEGATLATLAIEEIGRPRIVTNSIEEAMEMVGVIVFIHALLAYMESEMGGLRIGLASRR
jgi:hypothetical protein